MKVLKYIEYIWHRLSSHPSSGYGIHSPFVYEFATRVLNKINKHKFTFFPSFKHIEKKNIKLLHSIITYYKSDAYFFNEYQILYKSYIISECESNLNFLKSTTLENINSVNFEFMKTQSYLYLWPADVALENSFSNLNINNICILFVTGIRNNKHCRNNWKTISKLHFFQVSIDLFSCGICFSRKGLQKEFFRISF